MPVDDDYLDVVWDLMAALFPNSSEEVQITIDQKVDASQPSESDKEDPN